MIRKNNPMKSVRNADRIDSVDNRFAISNHPVRVPKIKLLSGSVAGKYPVSMDGGKTIIFITDKSKETETRLKYELRMQNRFLKDGKTSKV